MCDPYLSQRDPRRGPAERQLRNRRLLKRLIWPIRRVGNEPNGNLDERWATEARGRRGPTDGPTDEDGTTRLATPQNFNPYFGGSFCHVHWQINEVANTSTTYT